MSTTMEREKFPLSRGLEIQKKQLEQWAKVLKPIMYKRLHKWVMKANKVLDVREHHGVHVVRGTDLDMFIQNNLMLENRLYNEN